MKPFQSLTRRALARLRPPAPAPTPQAPAPAPSALDNVEYNRFLWDKYAREWDKQKVLIEKSGSMTPEERERYLQLVGDEWGNPADLQRIIEEYIQPFVDTNAVAAEIGSGGGRVASRVAPIVGKLYCFDISTEMLAKAKAALSEQANVQFMLLHQPSFPPEFGGTLDFVYSFDVFVHLDLHTIWKYLNEIRRVLKDSGLAFLHTSNLRAPQGWKLFASEDRYSVEGHYFVIPEMVQLLVDRAGLRMVKESTVDSSNFYFYRDYLFVVAKR